ncbi:MAG: VCBS repeat-containing protein, partial [Candidatus Dadabacteria bacterium]
MINRAFAWATRTLRLRRVVVLMATITALIYANARNDVPVGITTSHPAAQRPVAVDIDGDLDLDVVAGSTGSSLIRVYRSSNFGAAFAPQTVTNTGFASPRPVAAGDIDGDGDADLVAIAGGTQTLAWFENAQTDGTVWTLHTITAPVPASSQVLLIDVDRDGGLDVVASGDVTESVLWWRNLDRVGGSWSAAVTIASGVSGEMSLAAADFDRDGDTDIAVADAVGGSIFWAENSSPTLPNWTQFVIASGASTPKYLRAADMNRDGSPDLVAFRLGVNQISWWRNDGAGGFPSGALGVTNGVFGTSDLAVGDVNDDGVPDVLAAVGSFNQLLMLSRASTSDVIWSATVVTGTLTPPGFVLAADIAYNGVDDMVAASEADGTISWWRGSRTAGKPFFSASRDNISTTFAIADFRDMDGDGRTEIAVNGPANSGRDYYELDDAGLYQYAYSLGYLTPGHDPAYADLDGDGDLDGFLHTEIGAAISINNGDGTYTSVNIASASFNASLVDRLMEARDFDRDGDLDILAFNYSTNKVNYFSNVSGDASSWTLVEIPHTDTLGRDFALSDVDRDGDLDYWNVKERVAGVITQEAFTWYENPGSTAVWAEHVGTPMQIDSFTGRFGDLDLDGDMDFAGLDPDPNLGCCNPILWWQNTDGFFSTPVTALVGSQADGWTGTPSNIVVRDIDGDRAPDILFVAEYQGPKRLMWYQNRLRQGEGWKFGLVSDPFPFTVFSVDIRDFGDVDGDGDLDLVLDLMTGDYSLYLNQLSLLTLTASALSPPVLGDFPNSTEHHMLPVFRITLTHNGEAGDPSVKLYSLGFKLADTSGTDILSNFLSTYRVDGLEVYRDTGDDQFPQFMTEEVGGMFYGGPISDSFLGSVTFESSTPDADNFFVVNLNGGVTVPYGSPVTLFAVVRSGGAFAQPLGTDFNVVFNPAKANAIRTDTGKTIAAAGPSIQQMVFHRSVPILNNSASATGYRGAGPHLLTFSSAIVSSAAGDNSTSTEPDQLTLISAPAGITVTNINANAAGDITATVEIPPTTPLGPLKLWFEVVDYYGFGYKGVTDFVQINVQDPPPPTISAGGTFDIRIGFPQSETLATVSHPTVPVTSLTVNAVTVPTSVSLLGLANNSGNITATVSVDLSAPLGNTTVVLEVVAPDGQKAYDSFTINVQYDYATITSLGDISIAWNSEKPALSIATVSHPVENDGDLLVELVTATTGLLVDHITNNAGTVTADISASLMSLPGSNSLHIRVIDAKGRDSNLIIPVQITNSSPVFNNVTSAAVVYFADPATHTIFAVTDGEESSSTLLVTAVSVPAGISVTGITNDSGTVSAYFSATAPATYGDYSVIFAATDSVAGTSQISVTVSVMNSPPDFAANAGIDIAYKAPAASVTLGTVSDIQDPAAALVVSLVTASAGLSVTGISQTAGLAAAWISAPTSGFGSFPVTFRVTDTQGADTIRSIVVNVVNTPPATAPTAPVSVVRNGTAKLFDLASATDTQDPASALLFSAVTVPAGMSVTGTSNTNGLFRGYLASDLTLPPGPYQIIVRVVDTQGAASYSALDVTLVNTPPSFVPAPTVSIIHNGPAKYVTLATVSDIQSAASSLSVSVVTAPVGLHIEGITNFSGVISATVSTTLATTPGSKLYTLRIDDPDGLSTYAAGLSIQAIDTPPTITPVPDPTLTLFLFGPRATAAVGDLFDYQDAPAALTVSIPAFPSDLADIGFSQVGTTLMFEARTSSSATFRSFSVPVIVTDTFGNATSQDVTVEIVNSPPAVTLPSLQTIVSGTPAWLYLGKVSDYQTPPQGLTFSIASHPEELQILETEISASGDYRIQVLPDKALFGGAVIKWQVQDPDGASLNFAVPIEIVKPPVAEQVCTGTACLTAFNVRNVVKGVALGTTKFSVGEVDPSYDQIEIAALDPGLQVGDVTTVLDETRNVSVIRAELATTAEEVGRSFRFVINAIRDGDVGNQLVAVGTVVADWSTPSLDLYHDEPLFVGDLTPRRDVRLADVSDLSFPVTALIVTLKPESPDLDIENVHIADNEIRGDLRLLRDVTEPVDSHIYVAVSNKVFNTASGELRIILGADRPQFTVLGGSRDKRGRHQAGHINLGRDRCKANGDTVEGQSIGGCAFATMFTARGILAAVSDSNFEPKDLEFNYRIVYSDQVSSGQAGATDTEPGIRIDRIEFLPG